MSKFTIERYFTSIGRSFYISEEFDDLQKDNNIKYEAISNFGIGFLSSFMVCSEVLVSTKNISMGAHEKGLEVEIPNYQGCFFVRNTEKNSYGTIITLYEDERKHFSLTAFTTYINNTLIGLPVTIEVVFKDKPEKNFTLTPYQLQQSNLKLLQENGKTLLYVPFSEKEKTIVDLKWQDLYNTDISSLNKFGVWFNYENISILRYQRALDSICANQGLKISEPYFPFMLNTHSFQPDIMINFPSSFIQLDVAREEINDVKKNVNLEGIPQALRKQFAQMMDSKSEKLKNTKLSNINLVYHHIQNGFNMEKDDSLSGYPFIFKMENDGKSLIVTICQNKDIPKEYDFEKICFWEFSSEDYLSRILIFLNSLPIQHGKMEYKGGDVEEIFSAVQNKLLNNMIEIFRRKELDPRGSKKASFESYNGGEMIPTKNLKKIKTYRESNEVDLLLATNDKENLQVMNQEQNEAIFKYVLSHMVSKRPDLLRENFMDAVAMFKALTFQSLTVKEANSFHFHYNLEAIIIYDMYIKTKFITTIKKLTRKRKQID